MPPSALNHLIRTYDNDLPVDLCSKMIDSFDSLSRFHVRNGRNKRESLSSSSWTELDLGKVADHGFERFMRSKIDAALDQYNRDLDLRLQIPNSPNLSELIIKRYDRKDGGKFQLHFDSVHEVSNRYLVFLWYLNDVAAGGETVFPDLSVSISPKAGRLLMFPPYWMYQHEGLAPVSNDKFILSCYLLF